MKTQVFFTHAVLMLTMVFMGVGCAKKADPAADASAPTVDGRNIVTTPPSGGGGGGSTTSYGNTATFKMDNLSVFNTYVGSHPVNNPQNVTLTVSLSNNGNGRYGGTIQISYTDTGYQYTGNFDTGSGSNQISYQNHYTGLPDSEFNQWFTYNGKQVFHAFFQDQYGAIILVVDNGLDLGDGRGITQLSGSIYFKNFTPGYATQSPEKCWFIEIGPFDCRTFLGGNGIINTTSALYPSDGYQRLGTFNGLYRPAAFN